MNAAALRWGAWPALLLSLAACEQRPTVVQLPAAPVAPIVVTGPAGPPGEAGKPGDATVVVVAVPASAPASSLYSITTP